MINAVAVEGIDGAGKTTTCRALAGQLETDGLKAITFAPFKLANEYLGEDIYNLWFSPEGCLKALRTLREAINDCEHQARNERADVVIYDRHWMTAFKMVEGRDAVEEYWHQYGLEKVPVALLHLPVETALKRRSDELTKLWIPYMDADQMGVDAANYMLLSKKYGEHMLGIYRSNDDVTPENIARNIVWDMQVRR